MRFSFLVTNNFQFDKFWLLLFCLLAFFQQMVVRHFYRMILASRVLGSENISFQRYAFNLVKGSIPLAPVGHPVPTARLSKIGPKCQGCLTHLNDKMVEIYFYFTVYQCMFCLVRRAHSSATDSFPLMMCLLRDSITSVHFTKTVSQLKLICYFCYN